jgi:hypothetical protein
LDHDLCINNPICSFQNLTEYVKYKNPSWLRFGESYWRCFPSQMSPLTKEILPEDWSESNSSIEMSSAAKTSPLLSPFLSSFWRLLFLRFSLTISFPSVVPFHRCTQEGVRGYDIWPPRIIFKNLLIKLQQNTK